MPSTCPSSLYRSLGRGTTRRSAVTRTVRTGAIETIDLDVAVAGQLVLYRALARPRGGRGPARTIETFAKETIDADREALGLTALVGR